MLNTDTEVWNTRYAADDLRRLRGLLDAAGDIAIVAHYNPDGDAIGSALGLAHVLRAAGYQVKVVMPNLAAGNLHWMPGHADILYLEQHAEEALNTVRECGLLLCLDFNRTDRVGKLEDALKAAPVKVLVDHHQDPEAFAEVTFSDTSACATCQMVFDIVCDLGLDRHITQDAAICLYTGLVTDTGSFRFPATTPHTMRVAAHLMERGVQVASVHNAIMDDNTIDRLKLLGFTLNERTMVYPELATTVIVLSRSDLERFNFRPGDTEGFVNYGLSIRGIRMCAFFVERPDMVKVSLRSKGTLPVDRLVKEHFNGGGHNNAAGGQTTEPLESAVERFMALLPSFMEQHPA